MKLSQKIRDFEESCQFESLTQEQTTLESELREFELNLHKYENVTRNINKPTFAASSSKNVKGNQDYKEVQDFNALIAKTSKILVLVYISIIKIHCKNPQFMRLMLLCNVERPVKEKKILSLYLYKQKRKVVSKCGYLSYTSY